MRAASNERFLVVEAPAPLNHEVLDLAEGLDQSVGQGLPQQWPQLLGWLQLWRLGRQEERRDPLRPDDVTGVKSCLVDHEDDVLPGSRADSAGKLAQRFVEAPDVDGGH